MNYLNPIQSYPANNPKDNTLGGFRAIAVPFGS